MLRMKKLKKRERRHQKLKTKSNKAKTYVSDWPEKLRRTITKAFDLNEIIESF